jgi:hypothetical protein
VNVPEKAPLYFPDHVPASEVCFGFEECGFELTAAAAGPTQQIANTATSHRTGITRVAT